MEAHNNIEEIQQYIDGALHGDALKKFEQQLSVDQVLVAQVELIKNIDASLEDEKAIDLQKKVTDVGREFFNQSSNSTDATPVQRLPFYRRPLGIAACLLLLILASLIIWSLMGRGSVPHQKLYAAYYTPYEINESIRGETPEENLYAQAVQQYTSKNYQQAIPMLQEVLSLNPGDSRAMYCLAHAYLNSTPSSPDQAALHLRHVIQDGKSILVPKSKWYLALIYLKQGEAIKAKSELNDLLDSPDLKIAEQAKDLLKNL